MADMMMFPDTWEEFEEQYGITDREEVYTNGARLIPSFRVKQWLDHIAKGGRVMTIQGAIAELQNLLNADDVPFYYKGGIEKVIETI